VPRFRVTRENTNFTIIVDCTYNNGLSTEPIYPEKVFARKFKGKYPSAVSVESLTEYICKLLHYKRIYLAKVFNCDEIYLSNCLPTDGTQ
jgi:hypothetical protein